MKTVVRYYNKPNDLRISNIHVVPLAPGMWYVTADLSGRWEIDSHGSDGNDETVYFSDGEQIVGMLRFLPESVLEEDLFIIDQVSKRTYHAFLINHDIHTRKWDIYQHTRNIR
jgi:hypothetical protein